MTSISKYRLFLFGAREIPVIIFCWVFVQLLTDSYDNHFGEHESVLLAPELLIFSCNVVTKVIVFTAMGSTANEEDF